MTTQTCRRPNNARSVDLLPWADPYILQLFEEAELVRREEAAESDDCLPRGCLSVQSAGPATVEAVFTRDDWHVTRPSRPPVSRRRRIEFALELAPC
jgi:hypothetical protein